MTGAPAKEIHEVMVQTFDEETLHMQLCKCGLRKSGGTETAVRSGRSKTSNTDEKVDAIHDIALNVLLSRRELGAQALFLVRDIESQDADVRAEDKIG